VLRTKVNRAWKCRESESAPEISCSSAAPHTSGGCGWWYEVSMPVTENTTTLITLLKALCPF